MCMEDVRLGRKTVSSWRVVSVTTTAVQVAPADPARTSITFFNFPTNVGTYSPEPTVATGDGIRVTASQAPVTLTVQEHGDAVTRAWYGVASAGTNAAFILTGTLMEK